MRKGIFTVSLLTAAVNLYLVFGAETAHAQRCGVPGTPACNKPPVSPPKSLKPPAATPRPATPQPAAPKTPPRPAPMKPPPPAMASLSIYSTPGSRISINGKPSGEAAGDGWLYIPSLKPGRYLVKSSLNGHREASQPVTLRAGSSESLQMPLVAIQGTLNVTTNIQGATIEVEGFGEHQNKVSSLPVSPGNYQISAWKTGYKRVSQNEYIPPGQTKNIQIFLEPINVQKLLEEARHAYTARDFQKSIALCNDVLQVEPKNAHANGCIGLSLYVQKEYDRSFNYFVDFISQGQTLRLPSGRREPIYIRDEILEGGELELTQTTVGFYNKSRGKFDFKVAYDKMTQVKAESQGYNRSWRLFIEVLLRNDKGKEKKEDFHLYFASVRVISVPTTDPKVQYSKILCEDCERGVQLIYKLITHFRDAARH